MRGAEVTIVTHPTTPTGILWQGRMVSHTCSSKAVKQHQAVDSKEVNKKVEQALAKRPPQPIGHPWKRRMTTPPGTTPAQAAFPHAAVAGVARP